MDLDLSSVVSRALRKSGKVFGIENRMNLAINGTKALQFMHKKILHCNITPDNLMLRKIDELEALRLYNSQLRDIELDLGESYQLFIMGLNLAAPHNLEMPHLTRCVKGTFGFLGDEYFKEGLSHEKMDTFALGMSLIDFELATLGFSSLSSLFFYSQVLKNQQRSSQNLLKFHDTAIETILNNSLVTELIEIMDNDENKANVLEKILLIYPDFLEAVKLSNKDFSIEETKISSMMLASGECFEAVILGTLQFAKSHAIFYTDFRRTEDELNFLKNSVTEQENNRRGVDDSFSSHNSTTEHFDVLIRMIGKKMELRQSYLEILFEMIMPFGKRLVLSEILELLEGVISLYEQSNREDIIQIEQNEYESKRISLSSGNQELMDLNSSFSSRKSRKSVYRNNFVRRILL